MKKSLLLISLYFSWILTSFANSTHQPNVILFLVDDMGWTDIGVYGSDFYETPNIDALAEKGVRFTDAYAASHVCSPTRASLLTGKSPARLQLTEWLPGRPAMDNEAIITAPKVAALSLDEITIAEAFKANGYRTAIVGKWHLGNDEFGPAKQGFDFQAPKGSGCCPRGGYHPPYGMDGLTIEGKNDEYLTDRLTALAINFIDEPSEKPYFLFMSHFAVHDPIQGRADLVAKYRKKLSLALPETAPAFILEGNPDDLTPMTRNQLDALIKEPTHAGHGYLGERTVKIKQHQDNIEFAAMVESVDQSLGRILKILEENQDTEKTIIVFYSDNGGMSNGKGKKGYDLPIDTMYATSNVPLRGGKGWLYEGGIRVPLIIYWPKIGLQQGRVSNLPVSSADLYPTLLEMTGLSALPNQHLDGTSVANALKGETVETRSLFWHFPHYSNHGQQSPGGAIRSGSYKLLEYFENGSTQLFNLVDDPGEQIDLVEREPKKAKSLLAELHAWRKRVGAAMPIRR
ncbi:MAG: hypothetical protein CBB61_000585 [Gammaproteobacteria bacterium TMED1]|nr:MAG: hypothetical protein CBB61_000585 [Gammaproteobacteria bacterium TMED1]